MRVRAGESEGALSCTLKLPISLRPICPTQLKERCGGSPVNLSRVRLHYAMVRRGRWGVGWGGGRVNRDWSGTFSNYLGASRSMLRSPLSELILWVSELAGWLLLKRANERASESPHKHFPLPWLDSRRLPLPIGCVFPEMPEMCLSFAFLEMIYSFLTCFIYFIYEDKVVGLSTFLIYDSPILHVCFKGTRVLFDDPVGSRGTASSVYPKCYPDFPSSWRGWPVSVTNVTNLQIFTDFYHWHHGFQSC